MKRILPLMICLFSGIIALAGVKNFNGGLPVSSSTNLITIPVVVHVVYNNPTQNISDAQVLSQIAVLNKDFKAINDDRKNIPSYYSDLSGVAGFEFKLATVDPWGYSTNGITRKATSIQMFGTDERVKSSARGGDDGWNRSKYLNIWVCNLAGGILGYTSTVGCAAEKDGVTIQYSVFGTTGTVSAPFNLGRTATHEIGHWLNLKHIWGDSYCGDDEVDDTPRQRDSNRGRPSGEKVTCGTGGHGDMYMNFMDLTDDAGMYMFTIGQCRRMRALFNEGGPRHELLSSNAVNVIGMQKPVEIKSATATESKLNVFPNPAVSVVTVDITSGNPEAESIITIFNNIGQPVYSKTFTGNRASINVSQLNKGIYFLKTPDDMTKFVKN